MAEIKFIFQGIKENNHHFQQIKEICTNNQFDEIYISVAFVTSSGLILLEEILKLYGSKAHFYIGIRNGITSIQALIKIITYSALLFTVDTGSLHLIYHPKVYLFLNQDTAYVIIGSANLTEYGLSNNIEASTILKLDRSIPSDEKFILDIKNTLLNLIINHPDNVSKINSKQEAFDLYKKHLLENERYKNIQINKKSIYKKSETIKLMKLFKAKKIIEENEQINNKRILNEWILVWESNGLAERDLNIPSGQNTNPTGSMLLKKGKWENIDQRVYYRENVFKELEWKHEKIKAIKHLERANADFEIIIKGIYYGVYNLHLTHDSRKDSATYKQKNSLTQIHWEKMSILIKDRDLLDRILKLYKRYELDGVKYLIEID